MQRAGDEAFSGSVFTRDEHVGIRGSDPADQFEHRPHRGRFGDDRGAAAAEQFVFRLQALAPSQGAAEIDLVADDGGEAGIVPGFLDEVAGPAAHGFNGQFDICPSGHHHHRQGIVQGPDASQKIQTFLAGGGVAGIIEVHQHDVELAILDRGQDLGGRLDRLGTVTFAFEEEPQGLQNIDLVVGNENAWSRVGAFHFRRKIRGANRIVDARMKRFAGAEWSLISRPPPESTAVELSELACALHSSTVRTNRSYGRSIRTCLCDVNSLTTELRWTWSAEFIPLPADLPEPEGGGLKSALLTPTAVQPESLPQARVTPAAAIRRESNAEFQHASVPNRRGRAAARRRRSWMARHSGASGGVSTTIQAAPSSSQRCSSA